MSDFKHRFEQKLEGILDGKKENAIIPRLEKRDNWNQKETTRNHHGLYLRFGSVKFQFFI